MHKMRGNIQYPVYNWPFSKAAVRKRTKASDCPRVYKPEKNVDFDNITNKTNRYPDQRKIFLKKNR